MTANANQIAEAGYKKVLVAPAMKSSGTQWWARYQPQDLRTIDSPLGNKQDLAAMIAALNQIFAIGEKAIAIRMTNALDWD